MIDKNPAWLEGIQELNPDAIEEMYNELSPELYRYAYRLAGNGQDAEDILADTFIRLLQVLRLHRMEIGSIRAYLYRVVHNRAVDGFRRKNRVAEEVDLSLLGAETSTVESVDQRIAAEEVRQALWQLTELQRQVILLRYFQDLSYKEIGMVLDKPAGAVKALRIRGLQALRRIFLQQERKGRIHGEQG